jgi:hypothetical protein
MFTSLINWWTGVWNVYKAILQGAWDWTKSGWFWIVGLLYAFVNISVTVGDFIWSQLSQVFELIGQLIFQGDGSGLTGAAAAVNNIL